MGCSVRYLLALGLLMSSMAAHAATYTAASTSSADVTTAIGLSSDGDTVIVPTGSATWSSTVTVTKGITLFGGGGTNGVTTITQGGSAGQCILSLVPVNKSVTVKGFTWVEANADSATAGFIVIDGSFVRFCSNTVINATGAGGGISVFGTDIYPGLFDNNNCSFAGNNILNIFGTGTGSNAWTQGTTYGTTNYFYIEHNVVNSSDTTVYLPDGFVDCYGGAKFVVRYNNLTNSTFGWHGTDSGGYRAPHSYEVYGNTFTFTGANPPYWGDVINSRGGTGLVFSNTLVNWLAGGEGHSAFLMQYYREDTSYSPWGQFPNSYDGWQAGQTPTGYPGLDQQGRTGPTYFYATNSSQVLSPTYIWGNSALFNDGPNDSVIVLNRDYYHSAAPGYVPLADPYPLAGGGDGGGGGATVYSIPINGQIQWNGSGTLRMQ